jgi:hypothetical protein
MAVRRNARLRREYLYKKSLEGKEKELYEKKERLKKALEAGKPIPTDLRREVADLKEELDREDIGTVKPKVSLSCLVRCRLVVSCPVPSTPCRSCFPSTDARGRRIRSCWRERP